MPQRAGDESVANCTAGPPCLKERATKVSLIARAGSHALQRAGNESVVNYRGGQGRASQLNCTIKVRAVQHHAMQKPVAVVADVWQTRGRRCKLHSKPGTQVKKFSIVFLSTRCHVCHTFYDVCHTSATHLPRICHTSPTIPCNGVRANTMA